MHRSGKNYFFDDFFSHRNFSDEDFEKDSGGSTGSNGQWASSPNHVPCVQTEVQGIADHFGSKPELATSEVMNLTALRPLETHRVNGVESDSDRSSDDDLFYICIGSPSPSSWSTP
ncbi:hypothetical protein AMTRI_Chr04g247680 [Amborella trichopoda]